MSTQTISAPTNLSSLPETVCARPELARHRRACVAQDEFVVEEFEVLEPWEEQFGQLKPHVHRHPIPKYKQGGSVAHSTGQQLAPGIPARN